MSLALMYSCAASGCPECRRLAATVHVPHRPQHGGPRTCTLCEGAGWHEDPIGRFRCSACRGTGMVAR